MYSKSVRQRNVRQDNAMERASTCLRAYIKPTVYETETVLKSVNLNSLKGLQRVPSESDEPRNSNQDVSLLPKSPNTVTVTLTKKR